MLLQLVSFTGADDKVSPDALAAITRRAALPVEWGILYYPELEGAARVPGTAWRERFLALGLPHSAVHLCGVQVFREILDASTAPARITDLKRYARVQLNINARGVQFTPAEVLAVYGTLHQAGLSLILQYNDDSKTLIDQFVAQLNHEGLSRIHVLFDGSKGLGQRPAAWSASVSFKGHALFCGYAGGLGPDVVAAELPKIAAAAQAGSNAPYWIDMETGVRTDDVFDLAKVETVLARCVV